MKFLAAFLLFIYLVKELRLSDQFVQVLFQSDDSLYLNVTRLKTTFVDDILDCSFLCLQQTRCVSFNVAVFPNSEGRFWCELLPSTRYSNSRKLTSNSQSRHFYIQNPCSSKPCLNNGSCSVFSFRDGTYKCNCHPGYLGNRCEIDAPECRNFSVLSEPNRHYSYGIGWKSDSFLKKGWYRFQSPLYTRMIDNCIAIRNCSTIRTGWLNGTLPSIENGIVEGEVCFSTWFHCCFERVQIRVRKCAEAFYVYELPPSPNTRPSRYCARE